MSKDTRKIATMNPAPTEDDLAGAPSDVVRREFAKRLQRARVAKGWNQSELARRAGMGRWNISGYERGKNLPYPNALRKLADVLGVDPQELLPSSLVPSVERTTPAFEMKQVGDGTDAVWLRINQKVSWDKALKIMAVLKDAEGQ